MALFLDRVSVVKDVEAHSFLESQASCSRITFSFTVLPLICFLLFSIFVRNDSGASSGASHEHYEDDIASEPSI